MSANLELHERKTAEALLHDSDYLDGEPLDIGDGYSVAMHSATCRYCASRGHLEWDVELGAWKLPKGAEL
jgi:hypothetical protein